MAVLKERARKVIPYLFPAIQQTSILPLLYTRVADDTFVGSQGDTVTMRVGALRAVARKYDWRARREPIKTDDIKGGGSVDITFGIHTYSATELTDEHLKMDEVQFASEIVVPQGEAVADDIEHDIIDAFNELRTKVTLAFNPGDDPYDFAVDAQAEFNAAKVVPNDSGRFWLVGANVAKEILKSDRITRYDSAGPSNTLALRQAVIGDLAGLRVVQHQGVDPNFSLLSHKTGLVFGSVAPPPPLQGVLSSARMSVGGFAMRLLVDYDSNYLTNRSVVSAFTGLTPVYDERVGGRGRDALDLKPLEEGELPVSVRTIRVNFNGTNAQA